MEGILHLTQGPPRRRFSCPDEATLAAYIDGGIEPARRSRIEAHVSNCRYCLAQVGFALRLQNEELPPVPQALLRRLHENGASARRRPWPGWQWAAASVVAGCALLAGLLVSRKTETPPVQVAAAQQPAIPTPIIPTAPARATTDTNEQLERRERTRTMPSIALIEPRSGAVLAKDRVQFRWTKAASALYYTVRVATPDGDLVWDSDQIEDASVVLPATVALKPGQHYFVWVQAYMSEGKTLRTPATSFSLVP